MNGNVPVDGFRLSVHGGSRDSGPREPEEAAPCGEVRHLDDRTRFQPRARSRGGGQRRVGTGIRVSAARGPPSPGKRPTSW